MEKILLQGILYDEKSSFLRGAAKAPPVIRRGYNSGSANYFAEDGQEIGPGLFMDCGDLQVKEYFEIEKHTQQLLDKGLPVISLGGDHSITYPLLKAFHSRYGALDVLHIDAHPDLYDEFDGDRYSHACPFARILEDQLVSNLHQVGIRCSNPAQMEQAARFGVSVYPIHKWEQSQIPDFKNPVYISLDIDALDPAFAPGVSHHEPGGFTTREVLAILRSVRAPILGADLVEFNPDRDLNGVTAMLCGKLLKELAAAILRNNRASPLHVL